MYKKIISILLALVVTFAMIPALSFAEEGTASSGELDSIEISKKPGKLAYTFGEKINLSGIILKINYLNPEEVDSGPPFTLESFSGNEEITWALSSTAVGLRTVTVKYKDKTCTFFVTVNPKAPTIKVKKVKVHGAKISSSKVSGVAKYEYYYSESKSSGFKIIKATSKQVVTKKELKQGKKIYFKARTFQTVGGKKYYSNYSKVVACKMGKHKGAEYWRPEVKRQLKLHKVYSKSKENILIKIIEKESRGNQSAVGAGGTYVGLFQFGGHWKHNYSKSYFKKHDISGTHKKDNRKSGSWSIHRIVTMIKNNGMASVYRHWPTAN
ncbi:MAG: hypothetical protein ACRCUS_07740 [Anaerovoracaceae bacterium]